VTQALWTSFGLPNPSGSLASPNEELGDCLEVSCPVGNINRFEMMAFANMLSAAHEPPLPSCYVLSDCSGAVGEGMTCTGVAYATSALAACTGYHLPSDAEWEYAARAGTSTAFYTGDITPPVGQPACHTDMDLDPIAWYCYQGGKRTLPVGQKLPNGWGLHDMLGNSWEWTQSWFKGLGYGTDPLVDPEDPAMPFQWAVNLRGGNYFGDAAVCRASMKLELTQDARAPGGGFRLIRSVEPSR